MTNKVFVMSTNGVGNTSEEDDDTPQLSAHALAALQEFYAERAAEGQEDGSSKLPSEDWQLSQFWYDDETSNKMAGEVIATVGKSGSVACISCPSIFKALQSTKSPDLHAVLLEYDTRFDIYGPNFVHYDYNHPLNVPDKMKNQFDLVVADPPFLNDECLGKTAITVKYLTKGKVLLCTGAIMEKTASRILGVKTVDFLPKHKNNLANEFRCYANYETSCL